MADRSWLSTLGLGIGGRHRVGSDKSFERSDMLSFLALLFLIPSGIVLWVPMLSIVWGDYTGDQSIIGIIGFCIGLPGLILVGIQHLLHEERWLLLSILGVAFIFSSLIVGPLVGVFCDFTFNSNICGQLTKNKLHWRIELGRLTGLTWIPTPGIPGFEGAPVVGSEQNKGPYLRRYRLKLGTTVGPHRHSDDRIISVSSGTQWVAPGPYSDTAEKIPIEAGEAFIVPRGFVYAFSARAGDVTFDINGTGPAQDFSFQLQ
jgi:hypothetical protein